MNALLKYPGAKWGISDWIIQLFCPHHSYVEGFFGSGAILMRKPRSNIETVNDLDGEVINLFECVLHDPERMAKEIYLTPYARQVYDNSFHRQPNDNFERARDFFIRCNMGHGFRTTGEKVGWKNDVQARERAYAAQAWLKLPETIMETVDRLRGVQIENRSATELIPRFNHKNVLIYCDPPYLLSTRHGKQYRCEMTDREHSDLLEVLLAHRGPVLISGYENELYNAALRGWHKEYAVSYSQVASKKTEVLWMNYEPPERQVTFDEMGGGELE